MNKIKPNKKLALFLAKKELTSLVYDTVQLEGVNYTIPEVQTMLDGITVGGKNLQDEKIVLNQISAFKELFKLVETNKFKLNKETALHLHSIAGHEDALQWGVFRKSSVTIAGTDYKPPHCEELDTLFNSMVEQAKTIKNTYDKAIYVFLEMARNQFFYDVNKRMGRFMMNGILLSKGYPAINLPKAKQLEFNTKMLSFYESNNQEEMNAFMKSCINKEHVKIFNEHEKQKSFDR